MFPPNAKSLFEFKHNTPSTGKSISLATFKTFNQRCVTLNPRHVGTTSQAFCRYGWLAGSVHPPLPLMKQTTPENYFDHTFFNFDPLYGNTGCRVFKRGRRGTKLEIFLPKNQRTQRKFVLNFENWFNMREWVSIVSISYLMNFCEIIPGRGKNPGSHLGVWPYWLCSLAGNLFRYEIIETHFLAFFMHIISPIVCV